MNEKHLSQFCSVSHDEKKKLKKKEEKEFAVDSSDCGTWSDAENQGGGQNARCSDELQIKKKM